MTGDIPDPCIPGSTQDFRLKKKCFHGEDWGNAKENFGVVIFGVTLSPFWNLEAADLPVESIASNGVGCLSAILSCWLEVHRS